MQINLDVWKNISHQSNFISYLKWGYKLGRHVVDNTLNLKYVDFYMVCDFDIKHTIFDEEVATKKLLHCTSNGLDYLLSLNHMVKRNDHQVLVFLVEIWQNFSLAV